VNDRFRDKMSEKAVRHDTRLLGDFCDIYCGELHADRERRPLVSDAAELGVYGRRLPVVCDECAEMLRYAEKRRAYCPHDPKPFCANCETHCYNAAMRAYMQDVMRYAGPRSWRRGYAVDGIKHALAARKHRKAAAQAADRT
jgi:hypothetical protein